MSIAGRRAENQDAVCLRPDLGLFVVADGMGGYEGGEIASRLAVSSIEELVGRSAADNAVWPYPADLAFGPVENEEITKGYEYEKGKYVLIDQKEIDDLKLESKQTIELVRFVDEDAIDTRYFETPYYLLPDGTFAGLCIDNADHGKPEKSWLGSGCDVCRLASSVLLPVPAVDHARMPCDCRDIDFPIRTAVLDLVILRPGSPVRGPPSAFA